MLKNNEVKIEEFSLQLKDFDRIINGLSDNRHLAGLYEEISKRYSDMEDLEKSKYYLKRAYSVRNCTNYIGWNHHVKSGIKVLDGNFSCKDRFCPLCAAKRSSQLEKDWSKALDNAGEKFDLFHVSLTQPNCYYYDLKSTLKNNDVLFKRLVRILSGNTKIKGLDFIGRYGYEGLIKSLEITYHKNRWYHPHYHLILALRKGVEMPVTGEFGSNYNEYSDWSKNHVEAFTDFTILIQKIWRLLVDGQKVTLDNIKALNVGYTCFISRIDDGNYHQAFKYNVHADAYDVSGSEEPFIMTADILMDLEKALHGCRAIQRFGIFLGLDLGTHEAYTYVDEKTGVEKEGKRRIKPERHYFFTAVVNTLNSIEKPVFCFETPSQSREQVIKRQTYFLSERKFLIKVEKSKKPIEELEIIVTKPAALMEFLQLKFRSDGSLVSEPFKPVKSVSVPNFRSDLAFLAEQSKLAAWVGSDDTDEELEDIF